MERSSGQVAEQGGRWFPLAFIAAAILSAFSAYTYIKMSNASPSSGGIANYLEDVYGKSTKTASFAVLMYLSMVINESLVARTLGTYTLQLFDAEKTEFLIPFLGVGSLAFAFVVNIEGIEVIGRLSMLTAPVLDGVVLCALLWVKGTSEPIVLYTAAAGLTLVVGGERLFLRWHADDSDEAAKTSG